MVSLFNSTCARFDAVARSGSRYEMEPALVYVKGTWLPSEFTISICDGSDAWTGRASEEYVVENANRLNLTESEYVDRVQFYFSEQQPNVIYELKWGKSLSPELICSLPMKPAILMLQTTTDSGPRVAADMVQLLLEAHHGLKEELAKRTRGFEREIAAKERSLASLTTRHALEGTVSPRDLTNGHVDEGEEPAAVKSVAGTSSRSKRKAGSGLTETGSRKRPAKASEPSPLFQKPSPLLLEAAPSATRPPPLSALGYKQQSRSEARRETSKDPSWLAGVGSGHPNGVADDSLSEGQAAGGKKVFLDRLSDVAELKTDMPAAKKVSSKKKQPKAGGAKKPSKKAQPQHSLETSLDQVEDVVEKGIHCVDNITPSQEAHEVTSLSSPGKTPRKTLTTKPERKTSASGKKRLPSSPEEQKEKKKVTSSRTPRKKPSDAPAPPSEVVPEPPVLPAVAVEEDREIDVVNAEFSDFDASRSEGSFAKGQLWALYDDQDGMPRFYGHVTRVRNAPFQVSVEWLEPFKANCPAGCLVMTAGLSPSCGEFTSGTDFVQDLPAFSHLVREDRDPRRSVVAFWPAKDEIWALYRHWEKKPEKKPGKKEDADQAIQYEYDLVKVTSYYSSIDGLSVLPLVKEDGFRTIFSVAKEDCAYNIPHVQIQSRFSHRIPQRLMTGSESPGVPPGAWELDPASTPSEYLDT